MPSLELDPQRCIQCGLCAEVCPIHVVSRHHNGSIEVVKRLLPHCIQCGHCTAICPRGALTLNAVSPSELTAIQKAPLSELQRTMLFKGRRSIRKFKETPVPLAQLKEALEDARYAPTGSNNQAVEWLLVMGKEKIHTIGSCIADWLAETDGPYRTVARAFRAGSDPIFRNAPALILAHSETALPSAIQDACAAVSYLELSLHSRGIGSCWTGFLINAARSGVELGLALPEGRQVYAGLMVGFPQIHFVRIPPRRPVRLTILD